MNVLIANSELGIVIDKDKFAVNDREVACNLNWVIFESKISFVWVALYKLKEEEVNVALKWFIHVENELTLSHDGSDFWLSIKVHVIFEACLQIRDKRCFIGF